MALQDRAEELLDSVLEFPEGLSFERLSPITDLRRDVEEARILYLCQQVAGAPQGNSKSDQFVMKVKIQVPKSDGEGGPLPGPSTTTVAELEALKIFRQSQLSFVPHLITSKRLVQGENGLLPGGYITVTVMTKMPGRTVWDMKFWSLPEEERDELRQLFWDQLQLIWKHGIVPYDCALRNILWDRETRKCSIIDFEHWKPCTSTNPPVTEARRISELQAWGVLQRPPPASWAHEWGLIK